LQASPLPAAPKGKFLMERRKTRLSSPSLQTGFLPPHAAGDPACAVWYACDFPPHTRDVSTDRPANTSRSPQTMRVVLAPDCPGSRHLPAAWPAASAAAAHADTRPSRNTFDYLLAGTAETTCRKRHTADRPSSVPSSDNLSRVRYRSAVNGLVTNSPMPGKPSTLVNSPVHSREHRAGQFA